MTPSELSRSPNVVAPPVLMFTGRIEAFDQTKIIDALHVTESLENIGAEKTDVHDPQRIKPKLKANFDIQMCILIS
jgi:hypothetical protein